MNAWERATCDCWTSEKYWRLDGGINIWKIPSCLCEWQALYLSILLYENKKAEKLPFLCYLAPTLMFCDLMQKIIPYIVRGKNSKSVKTVVQKWLYKSSLNAVWNASFQIWRKWKQLLIAEHEILLFWKSRAI